MPNRSRRIAMIYLRFSCQRAVLWALARFLLTYERMFWRERHFVPLGNELNGAVGGHKGCAGDVKSLCAGVQPGDGRIKACIRSHFSDVSAPCQAVLVKAAAVSKACSADVKKVSADVKPGDGRIEACMKSHLSEVSDSCKDVVTQAAAGKS